MFISFFQRYNSPKYKQCDNRESGNRPVDKKGIISIISITSMLWGKSMGSYPMNSLPRGYCLIINNWKFRNGERKGSQKDAADLYNVFNELEFAVKIYENLTHDNIIELMKLAKNVDHSKMKCFVVIVMTHGNAGVLYGTDGKAVSIDTEIIEPFRGKNCYTLVDKPKLFIFQACRGGRLDDGVKQEGPETGQGLEDMDEVEQWTDQLKLPTEADILAAYAVPPGWASWRNETKGSWFIQSLVEAIKEYSEDYDLVSILTEVNRKVAEEYETGKTTGEKKQISTFVSQLRYKLYLEKRKTACE